MLYMTSPAHILLHFVVLLQRNIMKKGVFWDVTPCGSCRNRRFGGNSYLLHKGDKNPWTRNNASYSMHRLLVTASVVSSSPILVPMMKEALRSSETWVPIRATWRNITEDAILHSHRHKNSRNVIHSCSFKLSVFLHICIYFFFCYMRVVIWLWAWDFLDFWSAEPSSRPLRYLSIHV
jgi:hypothetical protein